MGGRITLGQFVAFTVYLGMLNWPMVALGWVINLFQRGMASFAPHRRDSRGRAGDREPAGGAVARRVRAARSSSADLTFTLPGSRRSGAARRLVPRAGGRTGRARRPHRLAARARCCRCSPRVVRSAARHRVRSTATTCARYDLAWLRGQIASAPQEPFLFSATVAENIAYGVEPGRAARSIASAARVARLDDDVRGFPHGYDTRVGERGITLSGGQKQRVAIARARAARRAGPAARRLPLERRHAHRGARSSPGSSARCGGAPR